MPLACRLEHYRDLIIDLGAADGFNTELPERLHIEYAKTAYKATNRKQYLQQMCKYLSRSEAIHRFDGYLDWIQSPEGATLDPTSSTTSNAVMGVPSAELGLPPILYTLPRYAPSLKSQNPNFANNQVIKVLCGAQ